MATQYYTVRLCQDADAMQALRDIRAHGLGDYVATLTNAEGVDVLTAQPVEGRPWAHTETLLRSEYRTNYGLYIHVSRNSGVVTQLRITYCVF